jgi:hypothetical protein
VRLERLAVAGIDEPVVLVERAGGIVAVADAEEDVLGATSRANPTTASSSSARAAGHAARRWTHREHLPAAHVLEDAGKADGALTIHAITIACVSDSERRLIDHHASSRAADCPYVPPSAVGVSAGQPASGRGASPTRCVPGESQVRI